MSDKGISEARERLRHAAQNEQTCIALSDLLRVEKVKSARLERQCDQLLAALKELLDVDAMVIPAWETGIDAQHAWALRRATVRDAARAAIAAAESDK